MAFPAKPSPSPAANAALTPGGLAGLAGLCAVASQLTTLLDRETSLIRAMKLNEIAPLQTDKLRLTKLCGTVLKAIDPHAPVAKQLKDQWRTIGKRLGDAALANEMALRVGHAATDKLVSAIIGHIERRHSAKSGYARPTLVSPAAQRRRPTLAGVTVDRHL
jgi:hypothetical protein